VIGVVPAAPSATRDHREQEKLQDRIRTSTRPARRYRKGEIDDVFDPRPSRRSSQSRAAVPEAGRGTARPDVKEEFEKIYARAGTAATHHQRRSTVYFITVPATSSSSVLDGVGPLAQPVFASSTPSARGRGGAARAGRVDPTGRFDEQLNSMFWTSHPYNWETIGWMSDLEMLSLPTPRSSSRPTTRRTNITAALVATSIRPWSGRSPSATSAPPARL